MHVLGSIYTSKIDEKADVIEDYGGPEKRAKIIKHTKILTEKALKINPKTSSKDGQKGPARLGRARDLQANWGYQKTRSPSIFTMVNQDLGYPQLDCKPDLAGKRKAC